MKTRHIITIISVIFALVSCSTESDILDQVNKPAVDASMEALISCSINNVNTKAVVEDDKAITSTVFFLLDSEGDVLAYRSGSSNASFLAKSQEGLKVLAVANASTEVAKLKNEAAIMAQTLIENDLNSLVKVGSSNVIFTGTSATVSVTVSQVAARIDLSKLNVTITDADVVTLKSVELINQNVNGIMNGAIAAFSGKTVSAETKKVLFNGTIDNVCHFYSFANNADNATALQLNFDIDGKTVSTSVVIKDATNGIAKVLSGANHQLNLTVTIQGENVIPVVTFTVADWNKSEISVDITE